MNNAKKYLLHSIFIGMILMVDFFIYVLLGLLLEGYSNYYGQGSGPTLEKGPIFTKSLVIYTRYVWYILNVLAVVGFFNTNILGRSRNRVKTKRITK